MALLAFQKSITHYAAVGILSQVHIVFILFSGTTLNAVRIKTSQTNSTICTLYTPFPLRLDIVDI